MASIKLGAFITNIAGSISGTTFRRSSRGLVAYNKQNRQLKSAFANKTVKNKIGVIFSAWLALDIETKQAWHDKAVLYPQKNKFNETVILSGRQFFTKLNCQLIPFGVAADLEDWNDLLQTSIILGITSGVENGILTLNFDKITDPGYLLVSVYPVRAGSNSRPSQKFWSCFAGDITGVTSKNIISEFTTQYPLFKRNTFYGFNCQFVTYSGFKSSLQSFVVEIE